jgi:hypothetical protein
MILNDKPNCKVSRILMNPRPIFSNSSEIDPVLETTLNDKETTHTLDFGKYFIASFWSHSIGAFSVLLEKSLKIISET